MDYLFIIIIFYILHDYLYYVTNMCAYLYRPVGPVVNKLP